MDLPRGNLQPESYKNGRGEVTAAMLAGREGSDSHPGTEAFWMSGEAQVQARRQSFLAPPKQSGSSQALPCKCARRHRNYISLMPVAAASGVVELAVSICVAATVCEVRLSNRAEPGENWLFATRAPEPKGIWTHSVRAYQLPAMVKCQLHVISALGLSMWPPHHR